MTTSRWFAGVLGLVLLGIGAVAQARVVGLVFDDSGSMVSQFQKALFAAQIVVGSLDESDRLFIVRLNGDRGRIAEVPAERRLAYLREMQRDWRANGGTPYAPLPRMLETLVEATPETEDAVLLVFTDGAFADAPPAGLTRDYEALRARFPGRSFQTFFVALPGDAPSVDVRSALLATFNGAPDAGAVDIQKTADIVPGLRDVVSVLVGADPGDPARYLRRDGATLGFSLPFSVRRILVLTSGDDRTQPASWRSSSFPLAKSPPLEYVPSMRAADPGESRRLNARLVHLIPTAPLPAATEHAIELDRAMGADDRILFVSGLEVELSVQDRNGTPLPRDAQGRLRVPRDQPVRVESWLVDVVEGKRHPVDLSGSGITPEFTLNDGLASRAMAFDDPTQRARANAGPYGQPGQLSLSVVARIKGLSYVRSEDLILQVEPVVQVNPTLTGEHLMACPDCARERIELVVGSDGAVHDAYAIEAGVPDAPRTGRYRLALEGSLPAGVSLIGPGNQTLFERPGAVEVSIAPETPLGLRLRYDDAYRASAPIRVKLVLTAAEEGLAGAAELELELAPTIAPMRLLEDGHTLPDQSVPFAQPVDAVGDGNGVYVLASGLREPLDERHLRLFVDSELPLDLTPVADDRLLLVPRKRWWSACFTPTGQHRVRLEYANPRSRQSAELDVVIEIRDLPLWQKCWREILLAILALLIAYKLFCVLRTDRFPPQSQVWRCRNDAATPPQRQDLHRPWRSLFSLGCANERSRAFNELLLVARGSGVGLQRRSKVSATLQRTRTAEYLSEVFAKNQSRQEIVLNWNEELRDDQSGYRYILVRDRKKHSGKGCD